MATAQLKPKPDPKYREALGVVKALEWREKLLTYRHMALTDLYFLCKYILGFWWLCDEPHGDFCREVGLDAPSSLYLLPRGHCKTLIFSIGHSIQCILNWPDQPIGLGSDTAKRAKKRIRVIRFHFEQNQKLRQMFPDKIWHEPKKESSKWTDEELILPGHDGRQEASLTAFGIDKQMPTGLHFPRIKLDDIVTPENTTTPDLMQNTIDNFGLVRSSILQPAGNLQICGTIYDDGDCHRTLEESGEYKTYKRPAESDPADPEKNIPLWPEQFSLEVLAAIKRDPTVGVYIYSCQYLLDPAPEDEHAFFQLHWFPRYVYEERPPLHELDVYAGMDFAIDEKKSADYTAIVIVGVDRTNHIYVLDVIRGHWDSLQIIDNMLEVQLTYKPAMFTVEKDIIARVLGPFLEIKQKETGVFLNLDPRVPVTDKISRARPLQGRARDGMVLLPKRGPNQPKWLSMFEFCLRRFPRGKVKDPIDAASWIGQQLQDESERWMHKRVFYMLADQHFGLTFYDQQYPVICGITPPGDHPFYCVFLQNQRRGGRDELRALAEMQIVDESLDKIARQIRTYVKQLEEARDPDFPRLDVEYTADSSIRERKGAVDQTYFYQFGEERIDIIPSLTKTTIRLDLLRESFLGHQDRRIIIDDQECPLLMRALRRRNGVL